MNFKTKFIYFLLKVFSIRKFATIGFTKPKRSKKFSYPKRLKRGLNIQSFLVDNRHVITFAPAENAVDNHIFLLHGGAYSMEATYVHWWLIEQLVKKFKVSFIDYPLAPEKNYKESHKMVYQSYSELIEKHPEDNFYLLGDSAGGGFCLSLAQSLRNNRFSKLPEKIVLLSPWVDVSMTNSEISKFEKKDLLLDPKALLTCARNFAGGLDLKDPRISPLYGSMEDLNSIGVFIGTHEILLPDCRKLKSKIEMSNTTLFYKEYQGMQHDWILFPIKEREILMRDVMAYLLK